MEGPASGSYFNPGTRTRITYGYWDSWGTRCSVPSHVEVPGINDDYQGTHPAGGCRLRSDRVMYVNVSGASPELDTAAVFSGIQLQPGLPWRSTRMGTALLTGSWQDASGTNRWDGTLWFHPSSCYDGGPRPAARQISHL